MKRIKIFFVALYYWRGKHVDIRNGTYYGETRRTWTNAVKIAEMYFEEDYEGEDLDKRTI